MKEVDVIHISIIIVTYDSNSIIEDCIQSIIDHNDLNKQEIEIIVVDNSSLSTYKELKKIVNARFSDYVKILHNDENLGYGAGNNVGIRNSTGNILCVMNPDVRLTEPLFCFAESKFKEDSKLAMLGYKQIGGANLSYYLRPEFLIPVFDLFIVRIANYFNIFVPRYFFLSGAFLFLDRSIFKEIGLFDENIFLNNEESDVMQRILRERCKVKFYGHKSYIHLVGNRSFLSEKKLIVELKSSIYYLNKYGFNVSWFLLKLLLDNFIKFIVSVMLCNSVKKEKFNAQFIFFKNALKQIRSHNHI